jgi:hypothetical protein
MNPREVAILTISLLLIHQLHAQTKLSGDSYLTPTYQIGEKYGNIFSRTIATTGADFQPSVWRISGTATYVVTKVTDSVVSFDSESLYDGHPESHGNAQIADSGKAIIYKGQKMAYRDGSGLSYNPLLWGTPPAQLKQGDSWDVNITEPWELGGPGIQKITVISVDPANQTVTLKREGDGGGPFENDRTEMDIVKDGKTIHMKIAPGKNHWIGFTVFKKGIVISDELLATRPLTLTSDSLTLTANQRQYILLNQMAE